MRRTVNYLIVALLTLPVANCGPALLPPGPPLPGFGSGRDWIAFVAVAATAGTWLRHSKWADLLRTHGTSRSRSSEVLRERYAKGEISREEYLRIANDLEPPENVRGSDDVPGADFFTSSTFFQHLTCAAIMGTGHPG
jgi:hypothetical protein